ncbi:hypothetical protein [Sinorhizobium fredii]|uniref:hypothetical protein n=1 Tax=Rhizobium fredii TaxID=380 RepID=UPI003515CA85
MPISAAAKTVATANRRMPRIAHSSLLKRSRRPRRGNHDRQSADGYGSFDAVIGNRGFQGLAVHSVKASRGQFGKDVSRSIADRDGANVAGVHQRKSNPLDAVLIEVPERLAKRFAACFHQQLDVLQSLPRDALAGYGEEQRQQRRNEYKHCAADNRNKPAFHRVHHRMLPAAHVTILNIRILLHCHALSPARSTSSKP